MNVHRLTAVAAAAVLAGLSHMIAAEENNPVTTENEIRQKVADERKSEAESFLPEMALPAQTRSQPADNLLSDLKIYPSF